MLIAIAIAEGIQHEPIFVEDLLRLPPGFLVTSLRFEICYFGLEARREPEEIFKECGFLWGT